MTMSYRYHRKNGHLLFVVTCVSLGDKVPSSVSQSWDSEYPLLSHVEASKVDLREMECRIMVPQSWFLLL